MFSSKFSAFSKICENPEIIDHQACAFLHGRQRPVGPRDRLEQVVVAQRLVEIHDLLDGRVETCQQTIADDQNLERRAPFAAVIAEAARGSTASHSAGVSLK